MTTISSPTETTFADIDALRRNVAGPVLAPDEPGFAAEIATFNLAIVHTPQIVVGATSAADVAAAVTWASDRRLPIAVQGAGHGAVAGVHDALLVSTSRLSDVTVDPDRRLARVGAGARWADVLAAAAPHGLAGVSGSATSVGVVGFVLGGGMGPLSRQYGFGADLVRSIELVTPDGQIVVADEHTNPDLFWALRGGKGNFGIVTAIELELVPVTDIYGGAVFFAGHSARDVLHSFRTWAPTLPDQAGTSIALLRLPPSPLLPPQLSGQFVVQLRFSFTGSEAEGRELLAPMLAAGEVLIQGVTAMPYTAVDSIHQDPTEPMPVWEKGILLRDLGVETVEAVLSSAGPDVASPIAMVEIRLMGGALGRQARVPNAVSGREGTYSVLALGVLAPGIEAEVPRAGTALISALTSWSTGTALVNWLGAADPHEVARAWTPDVYRRLSEIKRNVDPQHLLRFGHVILPTG